MTYTSMLPPTVAVNATLEPSGEKYGSVSTVGVAVRRRAWPPVRATAHRSPAYSKATRSLLTVGWRSSRVPCVWTALPTPNVSRAMSAVREFTSVSELELRYESTWLQSVHTDARRSRRMNADTILSWSNLRASAVICVYLRERFANL